MPADKLIQKFTIVRDHDNRARITSQIFLEPLKRFEIEMIRRFVEQKKIGLHHEQPREMSAHDPAAAQGARRAIEISFAKSESGQDPFCFWFELPPAVLVKNMERIVISRLGSGISDRGYSCFVLLDHFLRVHQLRRNGEGKFEHGFVSGSGGFLRKKSDRGVLLDRDRPLIGRKLTEEERKQR